MSFEWDSMAPENDPIETSAPRVGRRSFLVMLGALALRRSALPETSADFGLTESPTIPPEVLPVTDHSERIRKLLTVPIKGANGRFLVWVEEPSPQNKGGVMVWLIEEEDREEAERFFELASWRSWRTEVDLRSILEVPGPWIIRRNWLGVFQFLNTLDPIANFGPGWEDNLTLTSNPDEAAHATSQQAFDLVPKLNERNHEEGRPYYFEPVRPSEAMIDRRPTGVQ